MFNDLFFILMADTTNPKDNPAQASQVTENPWGTWASGEKITNTDAQLIRDFQQLLPNDFRKIYGDAIADSMIAQVGEARTAGYDSMLAHNRTNTEATIDTARNLLTGALGGTTSALSFGSHLMGMDKLSQGLARASDAIYEGSNALASPSAQAAQRNYQWRQAGLINRTNREELEDIANGTSEGVAAFKKIGKQALGSISNMAESNTLGDTASQGLGSFASNYALMGGAGLVRQGVSKAFGAVAPQGAKDLLANAVEKGGQLYGNAPKWAQVVADKARDNAGWLASTGLQEGGDAYTQTLIEGLKTPYTDLIANSPEFSKRVRELIEVEKLPVEKAQEKAREELSIAAANQAGIKTGLLAAALNVGTTKLAHPFQRNPKGFFANIQEGATELPEETITEGASQYYGNVATKDYLNKNQDIYEGVGESAAAGAVGALGTVGMKAVPKVGIDAARAILAGTAGISNAIKESSLAQRWHEGRVMNPKNISENLTFLSTNQENIQKGLDTSNPEVAGTFIHMLGSLEEINKRVMATNKDPNTGEETPAMTLEEAGIYAKQLSAYMHNSEFVQPNSNESALLIGQSIEKSRNAALGIFKNIQNTLKKTVLKNRRQYSSDTPLTNEQIEAEGTYLSVLSLLDTKEAQDAFNDKALTPEMRKQIEEYQYESTNTQNLMDKFFGREPEPALQSMKDERTADGAVAPEGAKGVDTSSLRTGEVEEDSDTEPEGSTEPSEDDYKGSFTSESGTTFSYDTSYHGDVNEEDVVDEDRAKEASKGSVSIVRTKDGHLAVRSPKYGTFRMSAEEEAKVREAHQQAKQDPEKQKEFSAQVNKVLNRNVHEKKDFASNRTFSFKAKDGRIFRGKLIEPSSIQFISPTGETHTVSLQRGEDNFLPNLKNTKKYNTATRAKALTNLFEKSTPESFRNPQGSQKESQPTAEVQEPVSSGSQNQNTVQPQQAPQVKSQSQAQNQTVASPKEAPQSTVARPQNTEANTGTVQGTPQRVENTPVSTSTSGSLGSPVHTDPGAINAVIPKDVNGEPITSSQPTQQQTTNTQVKPEKGRKKKVDEAQGSLFEDEDFNQEETPNQEINVDSSQIEDAPVSGSTDVTSNTPETIIDSEVVEPKEAVKQSQNNDEDFDFPTVEASVDTSQFDTPTKTVNTDSEKNSKVINEFTEEDLTETPEQVAKEEAERKKKTTEEKSVDDMDSVELAKKNKYRDDYGEVHNLAKDNIKDLFERIYGKSFTSLFTPVQRPVHLATYESPLAQLRELLKDENALMGFLRKINRTNASILFKTLMTSGHARMQGQYASEDGEKFSLTNLGRPFNIRTFPKTFEDRLVEQILSLLNPEGAFVTALTEASENIKPTKQMSQKFKDVFFEKDGQINQRLFEITTIAVAQALASMPLRTNNLNEEEMRRNGIDPELQTANFDTSAGILPDMLTRNIATNLRKFMGVAPNNSAEIKEYDAFLGTWAVTAAQMMKDAKLIDSEFSVKIVREVKNPTLDEKTGEKIETETIEVPLYNPVKDFKNLFGGKAYILEQLFDPSYRNVYSKTPPKVHSNVAKTGEPLTNAQQDKLRIENSKALKANVPFWNLFLLLGLDYGYNALSGNVVFGGEDAYMNTTADRRSKKGRQNQSAQDASTLREILDSLEDKSIKSLKDLKLFHRFMFIKNGRSMAEGASTIQGSTWFRQALMYIPDGFANLEDTDTKNTWYVAVAQNLGISTDRNTFDSYAGKVEAGIASMQKILKNPKYKGFLDRVLKDDDDTLLEESAVIEAEHLMDTAQDFFKEFQESVKDERGKPEFNVFSPRGFNAVLELARYARASTEERSHFQSYLYIENDGKNDGASQINSIHNKNVQTADTEKFFVVSSKTGLFYGLDTSTQKAYQKGSKASEVTGTMGADTHDAVAKGEVKKNVVARIQAAMNELTEYHHFKNESLTPEKVVKRDKHTNNAKHEQALEQLAVTGALLSLFRDIGWIKRADKEDSDIDLPVGRVTAGRFKELIKKLSPEERKDLIYFEHRDGNIIYINPKANFDFDREISKVLVTIIPYGSGVRGSTKNMLGWASGKIQEAISQGVYSASLATRDNKGKKTVLTPEQARDKLTANNILDHIKLLLKSTYIPGAGFVASDSNIKNFITIDEEGMRIPEYKQLVRSSLVVRNQTLIDLNDKTFQKRDVRNFDLTKEGIDHIASAVMAVFGAPAQSAVVNVLGAKGIKGTRAIAQVAELLNVVAQGIMLEKQSKTNKKLSELTFAEREKMFSEVDEYAPYFRLLSGLRVLVRKSDFVQESDPLFQSEDGEFSYFSSHPTIESSGVSGSPLLNQGQGDASVAIMAEKMLDELGVLVSGMFDGVDASILSVKAASEAYNKASAITTTLNHTGNVLQRVIEVGEKLNKHYGWHHDPLDALVEATSNYYVGNMLNGEVPSIKRPDTDLLKARRRLINTITQNLNESDVYKDSLFETEMLKKKAQNDKAFESDFLAKAQTKDSLKSLLTFLKTMAVTEHIKNNVLKRIPRTVHHVTGSEHPIKIGNPLSVEDAEATRDEINKYLPESAKFDSWNSLMAAYLNTLYKLEASKLLRNKEITQKEYDLWKQSFDESLKDSHGRTLDAKFLFKLMHDSLPLVGEENIAKVDMDGVLIDMDVEPKITKISGESLKSAFTALRANYKEGKGSNRIKNIYNNLISKVEKLLPNNTQIFIADSHDRLPSNVRRLFAHGKSQKALFLIEQGKPKIYIVAQDAKADLNDPKNLELLFHESIHAVVGSSLHLYYTDPGKLRDTQRKAIANLEDLLEDFMNPAKWGDEDNVPKAVYNLRGLLETIKNPAERMDEALAHILSHTPVMEAFSTYTLKKKDRHSRSLGALVNGIIKSAKKVWKTLLNIVTGSPMDVALDSSSGVAVQKEIHDADLNFMELFAANSLMMVIEEENTPWDDKISRLKDREGTTRAAAFKDYLFGITPEKDIRNAIKRRAQADSFFDRKKGGETFVERSQLIEDEIRKLESFENALESAVSNISSDAKKFVNSVVFFMRKDGIDPNTQYHMANLLQEIRKKVSPDFLVGDPATATQEEIDRSKEIYDLIQGESNIYTRVFNELPEIFKENAEKSAVFMALLLTEPELENRFNNIYLREENQEKDWKNPVEALTQLAHESIIKNANKELTEGNLKKTVDVIYQDTSKRLESSEETKKNLVEGGFDTMLSLVENMVDKFVSLVPGFKNTIPALKVSPLNNYVTVQTANRNFFNKFKNISVSNLAKEVYGVIPSNTDAQCLLNEIKGFFDKNRKQYLDEFPKELEKLFTHTKPNKILKKFLYRSMAKTNIQALSIEDAKKIFTKPGELQNVIQSVEEEIANLSPNNVELLKKKAAQLANYLTGDGKAGANLLRNPHAISKLLGERGAFYETHPENLVEPLDRLISLYAIKNLSKGDMHTMKELFTTDTEAMTVIMEQLKTIIREEQERLDLSNAKPYYINNYLTGSMPKGKDNSARLIYVTESQKDKYIRRGYKILGRYPASNIDKSEPVYRMYCKLPIERQYTEGIFQGINQTAFGYIFGQGTAGETQGTKIYDLDVLRGIYENYDQATSGADLIPIYDVQGQVVGYERAILPEDKALLNEEVDLFAGMAQYKARQFREVLSDRINGQAVELAYQQYMNASKEDKVKQYIDVMALNDPHIKAGLSRLSQRTLRVIEERFGGHLYLKADEVDLFLGHERLSITDAWEGKLPFIPKKFQKEVTEALELIFGKTVMSKVAWGEQAVKSVISYARDTIIIRSMVVPMINALANVAVLSTHLDMPMEDVIKYMKEGIVNTKEYDRLYKQVQKLEFELGATTDPERQAKLEKAIKDRYELIKQIPGYELIKAGQYSTISAEGNIYEETEFMKGKLDESFNALLEKYGIDPKVKSFVSEFLMTKNSTSFKTLSEFVNMSDWIAKYAGYMFLTRQDGTNKFNVSETMARNIVSTLFIDYDQPVGQVREYFNSMGISWFMTFKLRAIAGAIFGLLTKPSRVLMGSIMEAFDPTGFAGGTPLTENALSKFIEGKLGYSMGPLQALTFIGKHPAITLPALVLAVL